MIKWSSLPPNFLCNRLDVKTTSLASIDQMSTCVPGDGKSWFVSNICFLFNHSLRQHRVDGNGFLPTPIDHSQLSVTWKRHIVHFFKKNKLSSSLHCLDHPPATASVNIADERRNEGEGCDSRETIEEGL